MLSLHLLLPFGIMFLLFLFNSNLKPARRVWTDILLKFLLWWIVSTKITVKLRHVESMFWEEQRMLDIIAVPLFMNSWDEGLVLLKLIIYRCHVAMHWGMATSIRPGKGKAMTIEGTYGHFGPFWAWASLQFCATLLLLLLLLWCNIQWHFLH